MKNKIKCIVPLLLLLGGCSFSEVELSPTTEDRSSVGFSASIVGGTDNLTRADGDTDAGTDTEDPDTEARFWETNADKYMNTSFPDGCKIKIFNSASYSIPDYSKENGDGIYLYERKGDHKYESIPASYFHFEPVEENEGFHWNNLKPTSSYYIFEAAYFPGNKYFSKVETQQTIKSLKENDLLLAYHRQLLSNYGDEIKLTFHHVFCMIQVKVTLPVSQRTTGVAGFPKDALQKVYLRDMIPDYDIHYTAVINNDGCRLVTARGDEKADIEMCQVYKDDCPYQAEDGTRWQDYLYCAIIPPQKLSDNTDFIRFKIKTNNNKTEVYKFSRNEGNLSLNQEYITRLNVVFDKALWEPIVLSANVTPWAEATSQMTVYPESPDADKE